MKNLSGGNKNLNKRPGHIHSRRFVMGVRMYFVRGDRGGGRSLKAYVAFR